MKVEPGQKTVNMRYNEIDQEEQPENLPELEVQFVAPAPPQNGQPNNRLNQKIAEIEERAVKFKNPLKMKAKMGKGELIRRQFLERRRF